MTPIVDAFAEHDPTRCDLHETYDCTHHDCLPPDPSARPALVVTEDRLTEAGAAERFARRHGDDVRYDHRRERWMLWDRHHWATDRDSAITRLALEFARTYQREAMSLTSQERRQKTLTFAMRLERRHALASLLTLAQSLKPIADAGDQWDADPWLLGVPNGLVDLRTGELRDGRREDNITMQTAVPFDPDARCPRWERFLVEVFAGDADLIDYMHAAVGYALTGITTEQCLFLAFGTGSNGKGTFINTIADVLGDYAYAMPFSTIEMNQRAAIPNDLAALVGRRFVTASETNDGTRINEARVKALTGCDPMTARFLHSEFFTFKPVAKFFLAVNHKPVVRDDSRGFWRRLRLIPFTQAFAVNPSLDAELRAERPGILAWAVRGARRWQETGLVPSAVVTEATSRYERDSDTLNDFLAEGCELDPMAVTRAGDLYAHYVQWADAGHLRKEDRLTKTMFGRKVSERFQKDSDRRGAFYAGLRVVSFS